MSSIKFCKTFQDFKDLVAIRKQWVDFKDFYDVYSNRVSGEVVINEFTQKAADLYSNFKSKEAIKNYKLSINNGKRKKNIAPSSGR